LQIHANSRFQYADACEFLFPDRVTLHNKKSRDPTLNAQLLSARPEVATASKAEVSVRSFGAYTAQLEELVQWLKDCAIETVAMESTGVYWIPLFQKLEEAGFEVLLVDARQAKSQSGLRANATIPRFGGLQAAPSIGLTGMPCSWVRQQTGARSIPV
jgi:hypothetical protein